MLEAFLPFDHAVMAAVQQLYQWGGSVMDGIMMGFTALGEETFCLVLLITLYWCFSKRLAEKLFLSLYTALSLNGLLKDLICRPRPFLNEAFHDLRYVQTEGLLVNTVHLSESYSFPSGHSQTAGGIYGTLAQGRRWLPRLFCYLIILLVMVSRVYLGVHYPTDTIFGALLGLLAAVLCGWLFEKFYENKLLLMGAVVLLSCGILLLQFTPDTMKTIGVGIGGVIGMWLEDRFVRFDNNAATGAKLLRVVPGFALLMAIRLGLKLLFPDLIWFHGLRYALMGFAGTFLWPWFFHKVGF